MLAVIPVFVRNRQIIDSLCSDTRSPRLFMNYTAGKFGQGVSRGDRKPVARTATKHLVYSGIGVY